MKYLRNAILKTNAKYLLLMRTISDVVYTIINAMIVIWLTAAINGNMNAASKVIFGCIITTILSAIRSLDISTGIIFAYMSNKLADKIIHADYSMFVAFSPDFILVTHSNIKSISRITLHISRLVNSTISVVVNIIAIFTINEMAIVPIIPVFIIMALCTIIGLRNYIETDKEFDKYRRKSDKALYDAINGFAEVRSFTNTEKTHLNDIVSNRNAALKVLFKRALYGLWLNLSHEGSNGIATVILMIISITAVTNGNITIAIGINTVMYAWRIINPLSTLIDATSDLSECVTYIGAYNDIMNFENTVPEGDIDVRMLKSEIKFTDVSFKYESGSDDVLDSVSLTIQKGDHIGICGTSGGGKSTLLRLIPKFYDRTGGSISIDGIDIREVSKSSLKRMIGIVHQDPYIFNGSVMDNIKYADKSADYFAVVEACKKASIYDFIMSLPNRFDTYVGPKGLKLSGGQKQRIALARIFLSDPDIIILDEATSALDTATEKFIQNTMDTLFKDKTMIVVAHRLSTIRNSDKILVLDEGKIVEKGSHDELIKNKAPIYTRLVGEDNNLI